MRIQGESIARASFVILLVNLSSRVLGFLREVLIAHFFGARAVTDSFLVAQILPVTLAGLIGGALTTVFIPVFVEEREKWGEERAWDGTRKVLGISLLYLLVMLGVAYVVSPSFIKAIAPGFRGERFSLALSMTYVMLPSLVFLGLLGLLTGIFQSYRVFTLPALAGLTYNTCLITFLVCAQGYPVVSLALGSLVGVALQVVVLAFSGRRLWQRLGISFSFSHPMLRKIWTLMTPIFIGTGVGYLNLIVDRIFASLLPEGTIAALNFAVRVKEIPTGLFAVALSQAVYPVAALQVAHGKMDELRDLFSRSLETLWLFVVPSVVGFLVLPQETIRVLFERGAFAPWATVVTAQALFFYTIGLFATASLDVVGRVFYAFQDTKTPVTVGVFGLLLNIFLNTLLVRRMAHRGLALATSLSATFMFLVLLGILRKKMKGLGGRVLLRNLEKILLASLALAFVVLFLRPLAQTLWGYLGVVLCGICVYGVCILILRPRSSGKILDAIERVGRKVDKRSGFLKS